MLNLISKTSGVLTILVLISLAGCVNSESADESTSTLSPKSTSHANILTAVTDEVIIPTYQKFAAQTENWASITSPITSYCASIGQPDETAQLNQAQQSWRDAMGYWQQAEAFHIGPATDNEDNLRNRIYSWPGFVNRCTVDSNVITFDNQKQDFDMQTAPRQARGLDALEYLLFNTNLNHSCPSQITATQNWNQQPQQQRQQLRCQYASQVAHDIAQNAQTLVNAWLDSGNNYRQKFLGSGSDNGAFESQQTALNTLSDRLFYLDTNVKDIKLAIPMGLSSQCNALTCPDHMESADSDNGLANLKNNLLGFQALFNGSFAPSSTAFSFDDMLVTKNFPEIAERIQQKTTAILDLIAAAPDTFSASITAINNTTSQTECINAANNPDTTSELFACRLYGKVKQLTDEIKGDFLTVINLNLPSRVEGDND